MGTRKDRLLVTAAELELMALKIDAEKDESVGGFWDGMSQAAEMVRARAAELRDEWVRL